MLQKVETKEVECTLCGWIGSVTKYIPLRFAWCGNCRRGYGLRLLRRNLTPAGADVVESGQQEEAQSDGGK